MKAIKSQFKTIGRLHKTLDALDEPFVVRDIVKSFLAQERTQHPADLTKLADAMLTTYLSGAARGHLQRIRTQGRNAALRDQTEAAAEAIAKGEHPPGMFSAGYVIDDKNTWKTVAEMDGTDHRYVARGYLDDSRTAKMLHAFHTAIARKVGHAATSDVMSEDTYADLYRSIVKGQSAQPADAA